VAAWLAALALAGCPASTVHYGPTSVGTPWVSSGSITGHLFAYGGRTLMDGRVNGSDGLVLYTHGRTLSGDTKILWVVRKRYSAKLTLHATRLDGAGSFTQSFSHRGGQFPSIVDLPGAGCWRLSLRTGKVRATFVVLAVELPEESFCEPTRVYRDGVLRMPTTPSGNGIDARLFVSTLPGADRAIIYAGGRAPEGWATKFLWWSPKPAGGLVLSGTRLDAPGSFRQTFTSAAADDGTIVYPSIVDIPTPGCWAVRVTIGPRTGLAVFNAVVTS
jgi:hypothetical protein